MKKCKISNKREKTTEIKYTFKICEILSWKFNNNNTSNTTEPTKTYVKFVFLIDRANKEIKLIIE